MAGTRSGYPNGLRASLAAVAAAGVLSGCGGALPPAASTNRPLAGDEALPGRADQVLTAGQEETALRALDGIAAGQRPVNPPGPAPGGTRWSDVPAAVASACDDPGVEMTVVRTIATPAPDPDRYRFELRTVEGWPGELVVRRSTGARACEVESVSIGRFPLEPARVERGALLVKAFEAHLEAYGRKRWFNDAAE
jgi:hypothetical protein